MKVKEASLWQWLKRGIPKGAHVQRVENSAALGTPDVEGCIYGLPFWIELKVVSKASDLRTAISPAQRLFQKKRKAAGGVAVFLVQIGKDRYLYDPPHWRPIESPEWVFLVLPDYLPWRLR